MKKLIFLMIILLIAAGAIFRMDIKPETKDVVKQVNINTNQPADNSNAPPSQNVSQ